MDREIETVDSGEAPERTMESRHREDGFGGGSRSRSCPWVESIAGSDSGPGSGSGAEEGRGGGVGWLMEWG